ncbi:ATP-binding cassette domain-containing protein [Streptomyces sp. NPDC014734]|uniref:ATP-binding cassette domain-containing protein n=1 Tax=Streptomyces sp. NPDC014734 TaxID=3364886 RepID=UPI0037009A2B
MTHFGSNGSETRVRPPQRGASTDPTRSDQAAHRPAGHAAPVLSMQGIGKSFPGVRALDEVGFDVLPGEVHALVGENGAGKSTLMAVASGALAADDGAVLIGGDRLTQAQPEQARSLGLGIVRQHPALLPDLTVAENMALGVGYRRVGGLRRAVAWTRETLAPWEMGIDPRARVADLSMEKRFIVEIAKALALDPKVLILDEPTEHLSAEEVQRLFAKVRETVATGAGVVYISHRIPEVKQIADRVTVLRDGRTRGTFDADTVTEEQIVERVVGRELETVFPAKAPVAEDAAERLAVTGFSGPGFDDISLTVRSGEIVGLAGVQGNGQAELVRALAGLVPTSGGIAVDGQRVRGGNAAAANAGVVYVPADRHGEGVFLPLGVSENIVARTLHKVSRFGLVSDALTRATAKEQIRGLTIRTPTPQTPIRSLSGGNQQKAVMARTLLAAPKVLVVEEPTQGVDAGARVDLYRILRTAADDGAAVIVLSSDNVELEGLCHRVLIMSRGSVIEELTGEEITEAAIAHAALTSTTVRGQERDRPEKRRRVRAWLAGDQAPAAVLAAIVVLLGLGTGLYNGDYLGQFNLNTLLLMIAPLLLVGAAQQVVVMGAGFDLSVGPLMGLLVVIASYWIVDGGNLVLGLLLMALGALAVGVVNGVMVTWFRINPVVATLAAYMALQGVYLSLRDTPGGTIFPSVVDGIQARFGAVPLVTVLAVLLVLLLELALRRTRWGVELRALGSGPDAAERLGVKIRLIRFTSYVICSALVLPAGIILMAEIGVGDGRPGLAYTLNSVTVVVLAGAGIFGGRGSFVGIIAAAVLAQQLVNISPFLDLSPAWGYWLPGLITIGAAVLYAQLRRTRGTGAHA